MNDEPHRLTPQQQVHALRRLALAATRPAGPEIYQVLAAEVAQALQAPLAIVAVFADEQQSTMRTLAVVHDGQPVLGSIEYPLALSPCVEVVGKGYCFMPRGVAARYALDSMVADLGMDAYAAFPMNDSRGRALGLVAALDAQPIAGGDADHAESVLKIAAVRLGAELERSGAEAQLRASEQQYRAIFNSSADPMALWNSRFEVVDVNRAFEEIKGYRRDQIVGRHWSQRADAADMDVILPFIEAAFAGRRAHTVQRVSHARGHQIDLELRYLPVRLGGEDFVLGIGRDITERKAAEARLRASEEQYRAIFNASADALMLWDRHLRRVDVNPAHERIFGYAREDVVGRGFEGLNYPEALARPRLAMVQRALAGEASRAEVEALRKDGHRIVTELRTIPFQHRGEPHVLQIARDISDQRAAQAERAALEAQLRQAQKMEAIGQLTGGIAHDFNNILTSVIGYLVLAQERAQGIADAPLVRQLGSAHTAAQRARELIAQMLAFARRQRGDRRVIALPALVRQGLQLLRSTLPASILLDDSGLGDEPALPPVHADAVQLEQVLFNLCINARDAMPRGGRITVRVDGSRGAPARCVSCGAAVAAGRWLRLSVIDTGSGIDPAVLPRMFEPFFTTKEVGRGSGMGLAMVHGIVHEHEGHIVVDTGPERGSRFEVLLPVADGTVEAGAAGVTAAPAAAALRGRVMVVEDEPMVAAFMRELLEGWGLDIVTPDDALAAMRWLDDAHNHVDALITDLTMPQLSGLDLAHHAGVIRPDLPVLLYSGDTDAIDADALRRAGVRAVLRKPIDPPELREALRTHMNMPPRGAA